MSWSFAFFTAFRRFIHKEWQMDQNGNKLFIGLAWKWCFSACLTGIRCDVIIPSTGNLNTTPLVCFGNTCHLFLICRSHTLDVCHRANTCIIPLPYIIISTFSTLCELLMQMCWCQKEHEGKKTFSPYVENIEMCYRKTQSPLLTISFATSRINEFSSSCKSMSNPNLPQSIL